jgi:glycerate 2-kinase
MLIGSRRRSLWTQRRTECHAGIAVSQYMFVLITHFCYHFKTVTLHKQNAVMALSSLLMCSIFRQHAAVPSTLCFTFQQSKKTICRHFNRCKIYSSATFSSSSAYSSEASMKRNNMTSCESIMTNDVVKCILAAIDAVNPRQAIQRHLIPIVDQDLYHSSNNNRKKLLRVGGMVDCDVDRLDDHRQHRPENGVVSMDRNSITLDLSAYENIVLIAFGKASSTMAVSILEQLEQVLKDISTPPRIRGVVIAKDGHITPEEALTLSRYREIDFREASHPVPDDRSLAASKAVIDLLHDTPSNAIAFVAVSGGGSALLCCPKHPLSLQDIQQASMSLLRTGWNIQTINTIRRRLEPHVKGGGLARCASPARVVSLVLSDVIGDPLDRIASGPTMIPPAHVEANNDDADDDDDLIHQLLHAVEPGTFTPAVERLLSSCSASDCNVRDDEMQRQRTTHHLVGNSASAVHASAKIAEEIGYYPIILTTELQGEASQVAHNLVTLAEYIQKKAPMVTSAATSLLSSSKSRLLSSYPMATNLPVALIAGGETTVTIAPNSDGKGGRNQELALAAAVTLRSKKLRNIVLASVGTDGTDGPTDAAGGIVDGGTIDRLPSGSRGSRNALSRHDAYSFLAQQYPDGQTPLFKVRTWFCTLWFCTLTPLQSTDNISYDQF